MDLSWRTLTRADAPAMSDVYRAAAIADGTGDLRSSADMAEIFLREPFGEVKRRYFGVFDGAGVLVAFAVLFARTGLLPQHQLHLWGAVDPRHRRAGIGGELLARTFAHAEKSGATRRALITFAFNVAAQGLYIRHGFLPRLPIYFCSGARETLVSRLRVR